MQLLHCGGQLHAHSGRLIYLLLRDRNLLGQRLQLLLQLLAIDHDGRGDCIRRAKERQRREEGSYSRWRQDGRSAHAPIVP